MIQISIDGTSPEVAPGERLFDAMNRGGIPHSRVPCLPILGPIQSCDTRIFTTAGRTEAFDRLLRDEELHGTVCNNNHGSYTVHPAKMLGARLDLLESVGKAL